MWLTFAFAVLLCITFLYVPGALFCRGVGLGSLSAVVTAPLVSVTGYCVAGIACAELGIFCTWANVFLPVLGICLALLVFRVARGGKEPPVACSANWSALILYVLIGITLGIYMYAMTLGTPNSVVSEYDNAFHVNVARAFVDSGSWSTLDVSMYLTPEDIAVDPLGRGGFYPAAWHIMCALITSLCGCSVALAENTMNFVASCIVFPAGMAYLFSGIFKERRLVFLGAFTVLAFVSYPWVLFIWGPVLPNVFAMALMPAVAGLFIRIFDGATDKWVRVSGLVVFVFGFVSLAFSQPNALFFCVVFLVPYCVYRFWTLPYDICVGGLRIPHKALALCFVFFVVAIWTALVFAPFLRSLVFDATWRAGGEPLGALVDILTLRFGWFGSQWMLAVLVAIGMIYSFIHRKYLWITVVYVFFCVAYFLSVSTDGFIKHFIGGFWYCDHYRLNMCMAIAGIMLAAMGLEAIIRLLQRAFPKNKSMWQSFALVILGLFVVVNYCPDALVGVKTTFGEYRGLMVSSNDAGTKTHYSAEERAFVDKVKETVPEGALVVNLPEDGSTYAYGVNGLRVLYRDYKTFVEDEYKSRDDAQGESFESQRIRLHAKDIAKNDEVSDAFEAIGAQYVMFLDSGASLYRQHVTPFFRGKQWKGLYEIKDDTPGYELVLSDDGMKLFRITDVGALETE